MRLRLDSIDLYHVQVPLREPLHIGRSQIRAKEAVVLRAQTSRGTGWGEATITPGPSTAESTSASTWDALLRTLCPAALDHGEVELRALTGLLDQHDICPAAKAGLEMAIWHVAAMARDVPLHVLLGGVAKPLASGLSLGVFETVDELLQTVERHLATGYRRVKIEIRPHWDIEPVARIRQRWPALPLMVDAKGSYSLDHLSVFKNLDKYGLLMIEQPMPSDALDDSARLQAVVSTPVCLTDSVKDPNAVREIAKKQAGQILGINIQAVGGLTRAMQIHEAASKARLGCWLATTPDLGIAAAAGLHLATLDGFGYPTDVGSSSRWFVDDLLEPPIVTDAGGYLHLPDGPGYGYRPNREKVEKYTVRHTTLTA